MYLTLPLDFFCLTSSLAQLGDQLLVGLGIAPEHSRFRFTRLQDGNHHITVQQRRLGVVRTDEQVVRLVVVDNPDHFGGGLVHDVVAAVLAGLIMLGPASSCEQSFEHFDTSYRLSISGQFAKSTSGVESRNFIIIQLIALVCQLLTQPAVDSAGAHGDN